MSDTGSTKKRKTNHSDLASQYTFPVDYNDHFETPEVAYADIMPLFTQTALTLGKSLSDLVVYDPYWCQGRMVEILAGLGVRNVINNNRDFYKDIRTKSIPDYDILITNPPFSGEHKVKLLEYLGSVNHRSRPFAILLPIYTVTKSYWTTFILKQDRLNENFLLSLPAKSKGKASAGISPQPSFIYALAQDSYEYTHPEGTGKDSPPFYSVWSIGGLNQTIAASACSSASESGHANQYTRLAESFQESRVTRKLTILHSVAELERDRYVTTAKRPNPKQRKKKQKQSGWWLWSDVMSVQ